MTKAKLILLNGFAAAGKTTIAQKYIAGHPMALSFETDAFVDNIGDWINHEEEVRQLIFQLIQATLRVYLPSGHDVVLPYLVTDAAEARTFEMIAREGGADYYEFVLHNSRADAIARLLERNTWGEATSPNIPSEELPNIEKLMDRMESALEQRPDAIKIDLTGHDPDTTYAEILRHTEGVN